MAREAPRCDILACGLIFNDMVFHGLPDSGPQPGQELRTASYHAVPGGISNASIAAARLGLRVTMISDVGDDVVGQGSLGQLRSEGIDTSHCLVHEGWQTPLTVIMNYAGERAMVTAETPHPGACVLRQFSVPKARAVLTHLQPFGMPWLAQARQDGALIFGDIGWDESGRWDLSAIVDLPLCHSFTPNLTEALHYTGTDTAEAALEVLAEYVELPVITLGAEGAIALDRTTGERAQVPPIPGPVVDTGGAGDVFSAGLAAATLAQWPLEQRLRFAVLVSGLTVRRPGSATTAPNLSQIWQWHAGQAPGSEWAEAYQFLADIPTHGAWSSHA